ncbi:MAG: EAL domain-containing protein [Candidatus Thiodiazotropha taylori]|nr:EAL domain-containing protein [Candidatus Thiodiazotropha taylori]
MAHDNKCILFIEDEKDTRTVYTDFFQRRVTTVVSAENGKEGLSKFLLHKPDMVVTDIKMPDMNGIELIKSIREIDDHVPIIIFSAYVGEDFLLEEIKEMVNEVVAKPANTTLLSETIDRLLENHSDQLTVVEAIEDANQDALLDEGVERGLIVVGIGASAGGLEALTALMKGLPLKNNSAYLIAQHLSPTHKTMLVDLLSRETQLSVVDAEDGQQIKADTVYITPPNKNIEINKEDCIVLSTPESYSFLPKPSVNQLFISLAAEKKDRSIGIILSGTGSDGAQGMRAINAEGGITIVQEPATAKYDGMPVASINGCSIDIVIDPSQIGEELVALANFPRHKVLQKFQITQPNDEMAAIFGMLYQHKKVDFSVYKKTTIGRRIERRMVATKATTLKEYVSLMRADEKEVGALFKDILIGVTSFYRDPDAFSALRKSLSNYLNDNPDLEELRVWVPGTSTGEEAYSVLITLLELLDSRHQKTSVRLFATDIDEDALKLARKGVYSEASMTEVDQPLLKKYFAIDNNEFAIKKELREHIVFSYHNLLADPPFKEVDLVVCRNLLIYLTVEAQKYVMPTFHYALRNNGLLFLGKSENATNFEHFFAPIDKRSKIFKQIPSSRKDFIFTQPKPFSLPQSKDEDVSLRNSESKKSLRETTTEEAAKVLLPNVVVTNEQLELLYKKGKLDYVKLQDGYVSYSLYKMIDPRLSVDLRSLVNAVQKSDEGIPQSTSFIPLPTSDDKIRYIKIHLVPVFEKRNYVYVFYFQELSVEDMPKLGIDIDATDYTTDQLLELELQRTKEHMQTLVEELETTNEELQSTNEELQSSNEELQSTNEELETSNEELQSTNEELHTAYAELKEMYSANNKVKDEYEFLNHRYESLLDNINDGVVVSTLEGMIVRVNNAMQSICDQKGDKLLSMNWIDLDCEGTQPQSRLLLVQEGFAGPYKLKIRTPSELSKTLSVQDYLIKTSEGKPQIWSFLKDITAEEEYKLELILSEKKYKATFESANIGIAHVGLDGNWLSVNDYLCEFLGYEREELVKLTFQDITYPDDLDPDLELVEKLLAGDIDSYKMEKRYFRKDATIVWAMLSVSLVKGLDEQPQFFVSVIEDINQQKLEILRSNQAQVVFNSTQEGILVTDMDSNIVTVNPAFTTISGYSEKEVLGKRASILKSNTHPKDFYEEMWRAITDSGFWSGEIVNRTKDGRLYSAYLNINAVRDSEKQIAQYIGVLTDISVIKQSQEQVEFVANHDLLTGLPNRALMLDRLTHAIEKAKREKNNIALLFIDLDRFKVVNDGLGHEVGDKVLIEVAERFKSCLRDTDTISRIGGDEFVALLEDLTDPLMAGKIVDHIIETIRNPLKIDSQDIKISCSIGIAIYPSHSSEPDELLRQADIAMYEAKRSGRNTYRFASDDLSSTALEKATLEQAMRKGLSKKQFLVEFQPVIRLSDYCMVSMEALVRWEHPELGRIFPSKFIALAEETELITQVTDHVTGIALHGLSTVRSKTGINACVSINFAARDLDDAQLLARFKQHLKHTKLQAEDVTIELTERKFMLGNERQRAALERYRSLGVRLSVDDFGTGFSNLNSLTELPIETLKIDRSFVAKIGLDPKAEEVIKGTINIANALNMHSIAEGVETAEQYNFLLKNGCELAQGFYFSKPLILDRLLEKLQSSKTFAPESHV